MSYTFLQVLNPLGTILVVKPYRQCLFRIFKCGQIGWNSAANNTVLFKSTAEKNRAFTIPKSITVMPMMGNGMKMEFE